jgi:hypothetical protein
LRCIIAGITVGTTAGQLGFVKRPNQGETRMSNRSGATTTTVRLRAGPSLEAPAVGVVTPNTPVEIVKKEGDWVEVKAADKQGFVHHQFVLMDDEKGILTWLERSGPISPSRLAAEMRMAPREVWEMLQHLVDLGRVALVDDADSPDDALAMIVDTSAQMNRAAQMKRAKR